MKTEFTPAQLADRATACSEAAIRNCVHCGFCTATCPTYALLGDELDSPRGRIYLIKDMLENERTPSADVVKHIDRCLSCLACMTTCPSDVNYMHLIDHARVYVAQRYRRPWFEVAIRRVLAWGLPHPARLRALLRLAQTTRPIAHLFGAISPTLAAMLRLAPTRLEKTAVQRTEAPPVRRGRVAIVQGCVETVLRPQTRSAMLRLAHRLGFETCFAPGETCCGALVHHMGQEDASLDLARRNVDAWHAEIERGGLDAIVSTVSGCGAMLKQYAHLLRNDVHYTERAARVSALVKDVSEWFAEVAPTLLAPKTLRVAYHSACSLQHGQRVRDAPVQLLRGAGFDVAIPTEAHLCCGSAGVYNILQPEIAARLRDRKLDHLNRLGADVIATGNIGCLMQLRSATPVVHVAELIDWAAGGPPPPELTHLSLEQTTA